MRIGKQDGKFTAIATADADTITIRGKDLCTELIGKVDFTDYFYFLVTGAMPTPTQRLVTNAVMVAIAEHGLVPSVQAARMTLSAAPDAMQGAVAAGLLGVGTVVAGSSESAGRYLVELIAEVDASGRPDRDIVTDSLTALKAARAKVAGIGHPQHAAGDPRADVLLKISDTHGVTGRHVQMLRLVAEIAPTVMGRPLPINVSGAIPAIMLDAGYPLGAMKGLPIFARTAGLIAHLYEESQRPIGFIMSHHADLAIDYDGPPAGKDGANG